MRRLVVRGMLIGLAAVLSSCVEAYGPAPIELARVDPQDAAERAVIGAVLGTALGTGLGAVFAINPGIGAVIGAWLLPKVGLVIGGGLIAWIINATLGAVILLFVIGLIKR
jgi:uncharacterized membrane protein YeaQ/YmgE (transglycosylase-associated protein family)